MANAIPEKSRQQIDEFKAQENWGRREVDKNAKRVKELERNLKRVFKPHELSRLVERSGFVVEPGGSHQIVTFEGHFVTTIPYRASGQEALDKEFTKAIIRKLISCLKGG